MNERIREITSRLEAMTLRERALVLCAGLGLVLALWDATVLRSLERRGGEMSALKEQLSTQAQANSLRSAEIKAKLVQDSYAPIRQRNEALRAQIGQLDQHLLNQTEKLVSPSEMSEVLEGMLEQKPAMIVKRIEALPAEPMLLPGTEPDAPTGPLKPMQQGTADSLQENAGVYRHGMRIELEGRFEDVVSFLESMEELPWSLFWDQLHYEVTEYPYAHVILVVNTLSTREGWIGV